MTRRLSPTLVFSMALFPLGLGGFALGAIEIVRGYQSLRWPTVPAVVLSSRLVPSFLAPSQPEIRYRYRFRETDFVSTQIWAGDILSFMPVMRRRTAQTIVARYLAEAQVQVSVNPARPMKSALLPGPNKAWAWTAIFTLILVLGLIGPLKLGQDPPV